MPLPPDSAATHVQHFRPQDMLIAASPDSTARRLLARTLIPHNVCERPWDSSLLREELVSEFCVQPPNLGVRDLRPRIRTVQLDHRTARGGLMEGAVSPPQFREAPKELPTPV